MLGFNLQERHRVDIFQSAGIAAAVLQKDTQYCFAF